MLKFFAAAQHLHGEVAGGLEVRIRIVGEDEHGFGFHHVLVLDGMDVVDEDGVAVLPRLDAALQVEGLVATLGVDVDGADVVGQVMVPASGDFAVDAAVEGEVREGNRGDVHGVDVRLDGDGIRPGDVGVGVSAMALRHVP